MTFEELSTKDIPNLLEGHPAHYLEKVIKRQLLPKKEIHDAEHVVMCSKWSIDTDDYTVLMMLNGHADRFYHICLHLRFYKEENMHKEVVAEFESKFPQIKLEEIPLPVI